MGTCSPTVRYNLICFILEQEDKAILDHTTQKQELILGQKRIYVYFKNKRPFGFGPVIMPDGAQIEYYDAVCTLFEVEKGFKIEDCEMRQEAADIQTSKHKPRFVKRVLQLFK